MIIRGEGSIQAARQALKPIDSRVLANRRKDGEYWDTTRGGIKDYSVTFRGVLGREFGLDQVHVENRLSALVEDLRRKKGDISALDLMSYGAFHVSAGLSGTVVGLCDERDDRLKRVHARTGVEFTRGDIHDSKLWERLSIDARRLGSYDLIVARPFGASTKILPSNLFHARILTRVYGLLDANSGIFLSEYDPIMNLPLSDGVGILHGIPGVTTHLNTAHSTFMLVRGEGAPDPRTFRNIVMRGG